MPEYLQQKTYIVDLSSRFTNREKMVVSRTVFVISYFNGYFFREKTTSFSSSIPFSMGSTFRSDPISKKICHQEKQTREVTKFIPL